MCCCAHPWLRSPLAPPPFAGPGSAPTITAAVGSADGAVLTVQRPSAMRTDAAAIYLIQAYSDAAGTVVQGLLLQGTKTADSGTTGAAGDLLKFLVPWTEAAQLSFRVYASVGGARSPASAQSAFVVVGECPAARPRLRRTHSQALGLPRCLLRCAGPAALCHVLTPAALPAARPPAAGTPASPTITASAGSAGTTASLTFSGVPTATQYIIQPVRVATGALGAATPQSGAGAYTIDTGAGAWRLQVTARNTNGAASAPASTGALIVGTPLAPTNLAAEGAAGSVLVAFT